ncbi:PAS domain S-box protein [Segetibacter sp. 3557_3]|uniref:PAS domain S-box protein n=1 Tax=Segetibacter sp. 3557_3 TaxID=2547429 RepID=UPI001058C676|nr:PAS domain S-box protein [Segetibacter sp. 3557_3]TDH28812.1 PAS domain S-box protein [Segetibacter sp. 3557_3]
MQHSSFHVLVVEDNMGDFVLVNEYLEETMPQAEVSHAQTLRQAITLIEQHQFNVILLDLSLPDGEGITSFHEVHSKAIQVPIIVLTGLGNMDLALETVKQGAQDYIVKDDTNPAMLAKSIQYAVERKKIFEHLKASEEQYKYLFQSNPLPMWALCKKTHHFLMVNDAAIEQYGYTESEFLNMRLEDVCMAYECSPDNEGLFELKTEGNIFLQEAIHTRKNGQRLDVEMVHHNIVVEHNAAILVVVYDVTEQKKAKQLLRESEQMFRTISENFPNGAVAILDRELKYEYTAGKEFHVPEVDSSYFQNSIYTAHFPVDIQANVRENLEKVFDGESVVFEATYDHSSYMISATPLFEPDNSISKIVLASQNISRQKEEEQQLRLLESVITNTNDAIVISKASNVSVGHPIVYVNRAFTKMTGYTAEEIIGKSAHILRGDATDDEQLAKLRDSEERGDPCEVEVLNYKKDGTRFWCQFTVVPVCNVNGDCTHWISVQRDVSMRKRNEREKELLIEELTRTNIDLRQFSYITSHNLRAPLSNLLGIIRLLDVSTITDPMTSLLVENFKQSTVQLNETVNDLINVLIIKNNVNVKKEKLDLTKTFEKVAKSVQNMIEEFDISMDIDFSEANELDMNRTYLESILLNLLTNAIKYRSQEVRPRLNIYTRKYVDSVRLYFGDNGLGIDLDRYKDRIFGLYQRFHDHSDSKGLGLYIINSQITAMGGSIEVKSKVGKGTTFILTFKRES